MKLAIKKRNSPWITFGALAISIGSAPAVRADLLLTAQSVSATGADVNDTFDVYLTNIGASAVDVASFNFEINTSSSDISFQQATTATTLYPYIFAGNSLFGPVISTDGPGQTLDVSDIAATPNSFTVVNPGASFGLGETFFDVAPGAGSEMVPVTFNTNDAFTSVSDQYGNLQPLEFANGTITVSPVSTVPEPATGGLLVCFLMGCATLCLRR